MFILAWSLRSGLVVASNTCAVRDLMVDLFSTPACSKWGNVYGASSCLLGLVAGPAVDIAMCIYNVGRECYDMPFPAPPTRRRREADRKSVV